MCHELKLSAIFLISFHSQVRISRSVRFVGWGLGNAVYSACGDLGTLSLYPHVGPSASLQ